MANIGQKIKERRIALGMTQEDLAFKMGYRSKSTINKIELGINDIPQSKIIQFASVLHTTVAYLMDWEEAPQNTLIYEKLGISPIPQKKKLPLLGNVACGEPIFAEECVEGYVDADMEADFCLRAKGDSMINARIHDGDIVFVHQQDAVDNGEIAVVLIEDEATIKRVYYDRENNVLMLVPENPTFKVMRYMGTELNQIRILGKVIAGQYKIK